jgi:nicotinate-nucleotide adenylyltransferase
VSGIGLLGGTFDPIHYGHLAIAETARDALDLACVTFIPAGAPPHKPDRPISASEHRLAMVELAVADNTSFGVSRIEIDRSGPSYAVDTLEALTDEARARGEPAAFTFILSAEAFRDLPTWREPRRLLELCRMAVVPRADQEPPARDWMAEHFPDLEDRMIVLDGPHVRLSASEIRDLASRGRSIRYLVPAPVERYIEEHHLYRSEPWRKSRS